MSDSCLKFDSIRSNELRLDQQPKILMRMNYGAVPTVCIANHVMSCPHWYMRTSKGSVTSNHRDRCQHKQTTKQPKMFSDVWLLYILTCLMTHYVLCMYQMELHEHVSFSSWRMSMINLCFACRRVRWVGAPRSMCLHLHLCHGRS